MSNSDVAYYGLISQVVLVVITTLYTVTTVYYAMITRRMAAVMANEQRLRGVPRLYYRDYTLVASAWRECKVIQIVLNGGASVIEVIDATFEWSVKAGNKRFQQSSLSMPYCLVPGESATFEFDIPRAELDRAATGRGETAAEVLSGLIVYHVQGIDPNVPPIRVQCLVSPHVKR